MQRDGSGMDMGGQRPQSPGSVDNAPSPNKRPRLEGAAFNGQPIGGARSQGMVPQQMGATSASAAQAGTMLIANGMGGDLPGSQFNAFSSQTSKEVYTQSLAQQQRSALNNHTMAKGMNQGVPQGSPMGQPSLDGSSDAFVGNVGNANRMSGGGAPGAQGNHALQDYQMQLMLLEQQNKKRLLMARQEQDMAGPTHGQTSIGAPGFAPTMSPQGSRAGPSPNPNDQMKRGTPKLNQQGLPGSPVPDGHMQQNRASPVPNSFDPTQMPPGVPPQFYGQIPNNHVIRAPSSHPGYTQYTPQQMEHITRNGGRMPNGTAWPGGPPQMMPSQGQQQGPMGTSQQRNAMPPPPAPPTGGEPGRTNPSSPQQSAAPPTPSQVSKANPRGKKDSKETKKVSLVLHIYLIIVDIHYRSLQRRIRQLQVRLQPQKQNTLQLPRLRRQSRRCILLLSINSRMGQDSNLTCNHKLQLRLPHPRCSRPQLIPTEHPLEISLKM